MLREPPGIRALSTLSCDPVAQGMGELARGVWG